ncbi:hypothetical protein BJV78DRAFT_1225292 [Lactifluus subvellereus]|nr:hypothetical protein BJV78DRAFT_1225292 [Lactifluus subvellereus]
MSQHPRCTWELLGMWARVCPRPMVRRQTAMKWNLMSIRALRKVNSKEHDIRKIRALTRAEGRRNPVARQGNSMPLVDYHALCAHWIPVVAVGPLEGAWSDGSATVLAASMFARLAPLSCRLPNRAPASMSYDTEILPENTALMRPSRNKSCMHLRWFEVVRGFGPYRSMFLLHGKNV